MKGVRSRCLIDLGLAIVLMLSVFAVLPFLTRPSLPRSTDAELHVYRAAELGHILREGKLYPRWAPDFYYGYGYPIFNFCAPLTYYLAQLFDLLPGFDVIRAVKAVFVLSSLLGGVSMYVFAREELGALPGILAAVAYVYSPYLLLIDPYMRGNLAECFSFAIFPALLWAFRRLPSTALRQSSGQGSGHRMCEGKNTCTSTGPCPERDEGLSTGLVASALLFAGVIVTHNVMALCLTGFLLAYLAFQLAASRAKYAVVKVALCLTLGLGLTSFFWLPVFAERGWVQIEKVIGPGHFDFHQHFLTLKELLSPSRVLDLGATNPKFLYNIGLVQWLLAGLSVFVLIKFSQRSGSLIFFQVAALFLVFLMLPASKFVWESVPLMPYIQFPWRLLGPSAVAVSFLAGSTALLFEGTRWHGLGFPAVVVGVALILVSSLPNMYPRPWESSFGGTSPLDIIRFAQLGIALGTTATGEYLPIWVKAQPEPSLSLIASYESTGPIDKLDPSSVPASSRGWTMEHRATQDIFSFEASEPFTARFFTFYFPGWRAYLDHQPVGIVPSEPEGFITVDIPEGKHTLLLRFEDTLPRAIGNWASVGWAFAAGGIAVYSWRKGLGTMRARPEHLSPRRAAVLSALALLFFGAKVGLIDPRHSWFRVTSTGLDVIGAQHDLKANFDNQIVLLGYDLPEAKAGPGEGMPLVLFWKALQPVSHNYSVFVHLVRPEVHTWGQDDRLNPGDFPTSRWPLDKYVRDEHKIEALPGTPPGEYKIEVGFYEMGSGRRLPVLNADGEMVSEGVVLPATIHVRETKTEPSLESLEMGEVIGAVFAGEVTLLGYATNRDVFNPPDFVHLTLFWWAESSSLGDLLVTAVMLDEQGEEVGRISTRPVDGYYPTTQWDQGELVRDQYSFWLPGGFPSGRYHLRVTVSIADTGEVIVAEGRERWIALTEIRVAEDSR